MYLAVDGKLAGLVAVTDPIKPSAAEAIAKLHSLGLKIIMATGDNETTAKAWPRGSASTKSGRPKA
jgi:Cu+-exporting ATPase